MGRVKQSYIEQLELDLGDQQEEMEEIFHQKAIRMEGFKEAVDYFAKKYDKHEEALIIDTLFTSLSKIAGRLLLGEE